MSKRKIKYDRPTAVGGSSTFSISKRAFRDARPSVRRTSAVDGKLYTIVWLDGSNSNVEYARIFLYGVFYYISEYSRPRFHIFATFTVIITCTGADGVSVKCPYKYTFDRSLRTPVLPAMPRQEIFSSAIRVHRVPFFCPTVVYRDVLSLLVKTVLSKRRRPACNWNDYESYINVRRQHTIYRSLAFYDGLFVARFGFLETSRVGILSGDWIPPPPFPAPPSVYTASVIIPLTGDALEECNKSS